MSHPGQGGAIKDYTDQKKYAKWLSAETKGTMAERDTARELAKVTDLPADWKNNRDLRNHVTRRQRNDKKKHLRKTFDTMRQRKIQQNCLKLPDNCST